MRNRLYNERAREIADANALISSLRAVPNSQARELALPQRESALLDEVRQLAEVAEAEKQKAAQLSQRQEDLQEEIRTIRSVSDHSEPGWQTAATLGRWLAWLRSLSDDGEPVCPVLDCYSVHRTEAMRSYAESIRIHLVFIPPGLTDEFQPLDRFVFGAMKAAFRRLSERHCQSDPFCVMTKKIAAAFLIRAWEGVGTQVLEGAWLIYDPTIEQ